MSVRSKVFVAFVCLTFSFCSKPAKISLNISGNTSDEPVVLYLPDEEEISIPIDASGQGSLDLDISEPVYAKLGYLYSSRLLFLTQGTDLEVAFDAKEFAEQVRISGKGAEENKYLNSGRLSAPMIDDSRLDEQAFLSKSDEALVANFKELDSHQLSSSFKELEGKRLRYFTYAVLPLYPQFHKRITGDDTYEPSELYWSKLQNLMVMDASLLSFQDYRFFVSEAASLLARKKYPDQRPLDALISYVESDVTDPQIAEFLINRRVYAHVERNGSTAAETYREAFYRHVTTPSMVERFEELCEQWESLEPGRPSPEFTSSDVDGKEYRLVDFRGKYLYIDVWATWCGPCQYQIPYLKKLEERYEGKDIYFVSISCDADRTAWEEKVKSGMTGIQLHFDEGDTFMKQYMINGIPRFILLDKEGKIISSDMSRPSDPKTIERLDQLLNDDPTK